MAWQSKQMKATKASKNGGDHWWYKIYPDAPKSLQKCKKYKKLQKWSQKFAFVYS